MNKILTITLITIFLLTFYAENINALEFDNVKSYDQNSKTITIRDSLLGVPTTKVAEITLKTDDIVYVLPGKDRKVAEFEIKLSDNNYVSPIKEMALYNAKYNIAMQRPITYKEKFQNGTQQVKTYKQVCDVPLINGEKGFACRNEETGTITVPVYAWRELNQKSLTINKGNITIGLFTEVKPNDYVEWIPTLFGVRINEWAVWTSSLNIGIKLYFPLNTTVNATRTQDVVNSSANATIVGGVANITRGIINGSYQFANTKYVRSPTFCASGTQDKTVNLWINQTSNTLGMWLFGCGNAANGAGFGIISGYSGARDLYYWGQGGGFDFQALGTGGITPAVFHMITVVGTGTSRLIYVDGVNVANNTNAGYNTGSTYPLGISEYGVGTNNFDGAIDEVGMWNRTLTPSEIVQLYNGGAGMTYTNSFSGVSTTLLTPANTLNTSSSNVSFTANSSAVTGTALNNATIFAWNSSNTLVWNESQTITGNTSNVTSWSHVFADGTYKWNVLTVGDSGSVAAFDNNRTFSVDTTTPIVTVVSPTNNTEFLVLTSQYNVSFNATVQDAGALYNCWYYNSSANVTLTCGTNATVSLGEGYKTLVYYANDSAGNVESDDTTFLINYLRPNLNYSSTLIEGEDNTVIFNITATSITSITANATYNNTLAAMTLLSSNSTFASFYQLETAPIVSANTNINISVNYTFNGVNFLTANSVQTVFNIPSFTVSTTCTDRALAFSLFDEENFTALTGTFDYNFAYGTSTNATLGRIYGQISNTTFFYLCINSTISPNWTLGEGSVFYTESNGNYVDRRYYLFDGTILTNATTNITLYDLENSVQTSFKLEVEDTSLTPYVNKFTALLRWYPQLNSYNVVDMGQTDINGNTVIHVRTEDVDYRQAVYERNGTIITLEDPTRFICLIDPCTSTIRIDPTESDFTSIFDVSYTFDYNYSTSIWSFVYSDSSQRTTSINLTVYKVTGTATYPICTSIATGYVGALTCNTSAYSGNFNGVITRSASPGVPLVQKLISTGQTAFSSSFGLWLSLLIGIPIAFVFAMMSPIAAIIGGVIMLLPAFYFGAVNWTIVGGVALLGGIVMHFLKRIG